MTYFLGLDLGQATDPTALAVLERLDPEPPKRFRDERVSRRPYGVGRLVYSVLADPEPPPPSFHCRHLERLPLGTPYPAVASHVQKLLDAPPLRGQTELVVDATGVGRPVVDMLEQRGLDCTPVTITGGDHVARDGHGWRVPKRDLVSTGPCSYSPTD